MSYEFNGMLDSVLPNIYINKITLEQKNFRTTSAANKHDKMSPHIDNDVEIAGENGLLPKYSNELPSLRVIFDLFLEIPNVDGDDFWSFLFDDEISEYLSVNLFLFGGSEGKKHYRHLVEKEAFPNSPQKGTIQNIKTFLSALDRGIDYDHKEITSIFSELMPPGTFLPKTSQDQGISNSQRLAHIKQKFSKTLPDGTVVHKVPIQMEMELTPDEGAFPSDLSAIVYSSLNIEKFEDVLKSAQATTADIESAKENSFGRITTEVIINKGKVQDKGMIFYISKNQTDDGDIDMSTKRKLAFGGLSGQLWFGSVHKYKNRFMSGNEHDPDVIHPYLDYVITPCRRVQDFRQSPMIQKRLMNYIPAVNSIINSTDLRKRSISASWDNPVIFSDLISSVNHLSRIKLFFSIDWGRLIKQHCAIPALIDTLSINPAELQNLFGDQKPLSLKIYRERVDVPNRTVNENSKKLIYDKYPNIFYNDRETFRGKSEALSALLPITLDNYSFKGFVKHYSLTDYDVKEITKGKFKYSVEITVIDPTLSWLTGKLVQVQDITNRLAQYVKIATGQIPESPDTPQTRTMYNSYLGQFEPEFINKAEKLGFSANGVASSEVAKAISTFMLITKGAPMVPGALQKALANMLDPSAATPDSIIAAYEIFDTLVSQLRNFIEFFSPTKVPKTDAGRFVDDTGATFSGAPLAGTKMPVGASLADNRIVVTHTFDSPTEIVDTTQMQGGYHFFGASPNVSAVDMGLKFIDHSEYKKLSNLEDSFYTKPRDTQRGSDESTDGRDAVVGIPFKLAVNGTAYTIPSNIASTKGRFFTIQDGANVILPDTIKSDDDVDENEYQYLVNNIIRYKYNLFGNPDKTSYLGYDELNKKIPNDAAVTPQMERILKQYQSLAYKGAVFSHQQPKIEDPLISKGTSESSDSSAHPIWGAHIQSNMDPLPSSAIPAQEILSTLALPNRVNWAANVGQEKFLLALIMQHYFDLKLFDINLGTFNANVSKSPIGTLLNKSIITSSPHGAAMGLDPNWQTMVRTMVDSLPIQIKILMMNWASVAGGTSRVATEVDYLDPENEVFDTTDGQNSMFVNKFGHFWLKHQNIVEIEFLSGHGTVSGAGLSVATYEKNFGNSSVGSPTWRPLTISSLPTPKDGVLLCRFKKYRHSIFNQRAYDILDLPLYDEYFFLYLGPQSAPQVVSTNAAGQLSSLMVQDTPQTKQLSVPGSAANMLGLL